MREKIKEFFNKAKEFAIRHKKPILIILGGIVIFFLFIKKKSNPNQQLTDNYYIGNTGSTGAVGSYIPDNSDAFNDLYTHINEMYLSQNENLNSSLGAIADQQAAYQYAQSENIAEIFKALNENKNSILEMMTVKSPDTVVSPVETEKYNYNKTENSDKYDDSYNNYDNSSTQLRSWAADRGYVVGYDQATGNISINGLQFNESAYTKIDGYNYLNNEQMRQLDTALQGTSRPSSNYNDGQEVSIRGYLESRGHVVGWKETSQGRFITVDGKMYNADQSGIVFKNNSTYSTVQNIRNIFGI